MEKAITKIKSVKMDEGQGAKVNRLFPTKKYTGHHNPFVLLDEFFVDPSSSFPDHEHRGFEAITYMIDGSFKHKDNLGNKGIVGPGGVQTFNAGKSIVHSEEPGDKKSHGIQLWVNLPKNLKDSEPSYQKIKADKFTVKKYDDITVRKIAGNNSPLELNTEIEYLDIIIPAGKKYTYQLSKNIVGIIYVIDGGLKSKENASEGEGFLFDKGTKIEVTADNSSDKTRFILLTGVPHSNEIKQKGSFVK